MADIKRRIEHRGGVFRLRKELEAQGPTDSVLEILVSGPRGTGKSNGVAYLLWKLCHTRQNVRVLVIRTARSLLTDTFCKTFEEDVCPGHECIGGGNRVNRHEYVFPLTGSRIVLGGLDDQNRYYGSDWDVILLEEAVQFQWKEVEPFLGALRNNKLGWHAMIYATNPDAPGHWLKKRADDGLVRTYECHHVDNPSLWDIAARDWTPKGRQFIGTLARYTGVQHARHVLGLWRGAEGQVWDTYDERKAVVAAVPPDLVEYRGSIDWGFADAGVFGVWGIDEAKNTTLVACWYQTGRNLEWWSERICEAAREYGVSRIVADPSRNDAIDLVNDRLAAAGVGRLVWGADNRRASSQRGDLGGLDLVRWGFEQDKIRFWSGAMRGAPDAGLLEEKLPVTPWAEIPEYVWLRDARGDVVPDRTDPKCVDHACFVAGTKIDGRPIESIRVGDLVSTPVGKRRVVAAQMTDEDAEVYELRTALGSVVRGTGNHPVWTINGWKRLDSLMPCDTLASCHTKQKSWSGVGTSGVDTRQAQTEAIASTSDEARSSCTARFGSRSTGRYPPVGTFITRTKILETTIRRTLSLFMGTSTSAITPSSLIVERSPSGTSERRSQPPPSGTDPKKGASGIASTRRTSGSETFVEKSADAISAERNTLRLRENLRGFAATTARVHGAERQGRTTCSVLARSAVRASSSTNTDRVGIVHDRVRSVRAVGRSAVYNIAVEDVGVYFAEGVLVSNCDMIRYHATDLWPRKIVRPDVPMEGAKVDALGYVHHTPATLLRERLRKERMLEADGYDRRDIAERLEELTRQAEDELSG